MLRSFAMKLMLSSLFPIFSWINHCSWMDTITYLTAIVECIKCIKCIFLKVCPVFRFWGPLIFCFPFINPSMFLVWQLGFDFAANCRAATWATHAGCICCSSVQQAMECKLFLDIFMFTVSTKISTCGCNFIQVRVTGRQKNFLSQLSGF